MTELLVGTIDRSEQSQYNHKLNVNTARTKIGCFIGHLYLSIVWKILIAIIIIYVGAMNRITSSF